MIETGASATRRRPVVIAHRGASGYRPEHTLAAYALAIDQGADFIEPDLVVTRDGVLVARHENELSRTTDVAECPEFRPRRTRKLVDGNSVEGWFSEDFSLGELKTLRAREPSPGSRPCSAAFDRCFDIPTLQEIIDLLSAGQERCDAAATVNASPTRLRCGLYAELKHPAFYVAQGFDTARLLVETLRSNGLAHERERVFIQSFEIRTLETLRRLTDLPLVQLIDATGAAYDSEAAGGVGTYRDLTTAAGLAGVATYADVIGPAKALVAPRSADGGIDQPAALLEDAHRLSLLVHAWTFRMEDPGPAEHPTRQPSDRDTAEKNLAAEIGRYLATGLDGLFTDNPDVAVRARAAVVRG